MNDRKIPFVNFVAIIMSVSCVNGAEPKSALQSSHTRVIANRQITSCSLNHSHFVEIRKTRENHRSWGLSKYSDPTPPRPPELIAAITPITYDDYDWKCETKVTSPIQSECLLSDDEKAALNAYTSDQGFPYILREFDPKRGEVDKRRWPLGSVNWKKIAQDLESALTKLPPFEGQVFRGEAAVSPKRVDEIVKIYESGRDFYFGVEGVSTLASSTLSCRTAKCFARGHLATEYSIVYVINQRSGRLVSAFSPSHEFEKEVIIPRGIGFKIVDFQPVGWESELLVFLEEK